MPEPLLKMSADLALVPQTQREGELVERLQALFASHLHVAVPDADTDLYQAGILDSLQFVELLCQLELHFGCRIAMEHLEFDDFRTLNAIAAFLAANSRPSAARQPR